MKLLKFAVFLLPMLSGCASMNVSEKHSHPRHDEIVARGGKVLLVSDFCIFKDNALDQDYFLIDESAKTGAWVQKEVFEYLRSKNLTAQGIEMPFVCGAIGQKAKEIELYVAANEESEAHVAEPPFYVASAYLDDVAYQQALAIVMNQVNDQVFPEKNSDGKVPIAQPDISEELSIIRDRTGYDAALFILSGGSQVSTAKTMTQGVLTGLLTAALFGGVGYSMPVSATNLSANLVDLNDGALLWSKRHQVQKSPVTFSTPQAFEPNWRQKLLSEMLDVKVLPRQAVIQTAPDSSVSEIEESVQDNPIGALESHADIAELKTPENGVGKEQKEYTQAAEVSPEEPAEARFVPQVPTPLPTEPVDEGPTVEEQLEDLKAKRVRGEMSGDEYLSERQKIINGES